MPFTVNDPGHVAEHNRIAQALPPGFVPASTDSPALTGTPTAPTPANGDSSGSIATTEFVTENAVAAPPDSVQTAFKQITNVTGRQPADAGSGGNTRAWLAKPNGDGMPGVFDMLHHDTTGYIFHLQTGTVGAAPDAAGSNPAYTIGIGLDTDNGVGGLGVGGILIANKKGAQGINLHNYSAITHADAYGFLGLQESSLAPLVRLEQDSASGAPVLQLIANLAAGSTALLLQVVTASGTTGSIAAVDGSMSWQAPITVSDPNTTTANYIQATTTGQTPANQRNYARLTKTGLAIWSWSGSNGVWYPRGLLTSGQDISLVVAANAADQSTPPALVALKARYTSGAAALGFFTASPINQKARVGALTDSSGGTSGGATISAVTDVPTAANAIATLAAKVNALEAVLSAAGGGFGLTA